MAKEKQYTSRENPFRWQIQEQYRRLVDALSQVSEKRMQEIAAFITKQLEANPVFLSKIQEQLRNMIIHQMQDHITDVTSRENFEKEIEAELRWRSEKAIEEEQDNESYLDSFDGADRAFMENYLNGGFGRESDDYSEDEEDEYERTRDLTEQEEAEAERTEQEEYENWVERKLEDIGDQDDPQNLLDQLFDTNEGYSWFVHELLVYIMDLESSLVDEIEFGADGITQRELSILFTAINLYINWEAFDLGEDDYILKSLSRALDKLCEDKVGDYDFGVERLRDRVLLYNEDGLPEEFHEIEAKYNEAHSRNDLIAMQRIWSLYTAYRKFLNDTEVLKEDGGSVVSYEDSISAVSSLRAAKLLRLFNKTTDRADKCYGMRVYPHPDTKALSYTDDGGHTTTFNLAELMGELEHVGKEIEKYKPKKQNVFVPVFVFVVSTKPKSSGDEVIREFITVRLDLDYEHRLLSKNPGDGVLADTDNLDAIAQADIIRGYETFSTRAAGEKAAKDALKGVSSTNINHSERIFLQVMRKPENHEKLVQLLRDKVKELFGDEEGKYMVDALALIGYSTNTICEYCSPTLLYFQNTREDGDPVMMLMQALNHHIDGEIQFTTRGFDRVREEQDFTQFRIQTIVTGAINFSSQAHDLTDKHCGTKQPKPPKTTYNPKAKLVMDEDSIPLHMTAQNKDLSHAPGQPIIEFSGVSHLSDFAPSGDPFSGITFTSGGKPWYGGLPEGILKTIDLQKLLTSAFLNYNIKSGANLIVPNGYTDVDHDGWCFYHAIVVLQGRNTAQELVTMAIDDILNHLEDYQAFLQGIDIPIPGFAEMNTTQAMQAYLNYHMQHNDGGDNIWADNLMIQATANVLRINIQVHMFNLDGTPQLHQDGEVVLNFQPNDGHAGETIVIGNIANLHFVAQGETQADLEEDEPITATALNIPNSTVPEIHSDADIPFPELNPPSMSGVGSLFSDLSM
jgi:hypothetical protein